MIGKKDKTESTGSGSNSLAHELVAREEQNIGIFFAAFAIQYYMTKPLLKKQLNKPNFLLYFGDVEIYASQRVLIKNIIANEKYHSFCEDIEVLLLEHNQNAEKLPHDIYLKSINKSFLIRQIFKQTEQILPKYDFIENFMELDITQLDLYDLNKQMSVLPIEEQILVVVRIFNNMKDSFENKRRPIMVSFIENIKRTKSEYMSKGKVSGQEFINLEMLSDNFIES